MCAPLMRPTAYTAIATASPHAKVMTTQPAFSALEFVSRTPATTPSPSSMRIKVPTNSAINMSTSYSFLERSARGHVARRFQVTFHVLVELEERDGEARHLQRGHVLPDVRHPPNLYALALQDVGDVGVGDVELHEWRTAEAVDHHGDVSLREVDGVVEDLP